MSKILTLTVAALIATPAAAANGSAGNSGPNHDLRLALRQMIQSNGDSPPGQNTRPFDPGKGDDKAFDGAIFEVCTKNTPAA